jgi:hypothetical protein
MSVRVEFPDRIRVLEKNFKQLDNEGHRQELDERISQEAETQQAALAEFRDQAPAEKEREAFAKAARLPSVGQTFLKQVLTHMLIAYRDFFPSRGGCNWRFNYVFSFNCFGGSFFHPARSRIITVNN